MYGRLPERPNGRAFAAWDAREAAISYARAGLWVLPLRWVEREGLCSCGRADCPTPGKHLRNRCATRDPGVIRDWWRRWPTANVGLATGRQNGLLVLDVDAAGGNRSLRELARRHGPLPATLAVRTGGGGRHLYFRHPGARIASPEDWRPGIDLRADGAYVVAPPSLHRSGRRYEWIDRKGPAAVADIPGWLRKLLPRDA